jgi:hypothetical protein
MLTRLTGKNTDPTDESFVELHFVFATLSENSPGRDPAELSCSGHEVSRCRDYVFNWACGRVVLNARTFYGLTRTVSL